MPYALETLMTRLEKKNVAIAKKAATTKKHSQRYLKNLQKKTAEEMQWDYSYSDMTNSARDLKYLLKERKEILKLIADAKKDQITLPAVLDGYRMDLEKNFISDRIWRRDWLMGQWKEVYKPLVNACSYDIFNMFVNTKYRKCFSWDFKTGYSLKKDAVIDEEDKAALEIFTKCQEAESWKESNNDKMHESDESIAKRSARDAKALVEDLYKRTFGFTGETTDYSGLTISQDNNGFSIINGVITGKDGSCRVESIGAGGYNIQCWHIRVLVHSNNKV